MKELIDSILYDTDQAKLLHTWHGYRCSSDGVGMPVTEHLYLGKGGHYFLHVIYRSESSLFWKALTGNWHDTEHIERIVSERGARDWAFRHGADVTKLGLQEPEIA